MKLLSCPSCQSFVPPLTSICPNCSARAPVNPLVRAALAVGVGSALSVTLMACYGLPPCETSNDNDGDGVGSADANGTCAAGELDCNDDDADIHPGADDLTVDGVDQNCDGTDGPIADGEGEGEAAGEGEGEGE